MEPGSAPLRASPKEPRNKRRIDQHFAVFEVEGSVYREMRYWFEKWSDSAFPDMFGIPEDRMAGGGIGSDENPIRPSGCTTAEFESLLEVMYPRDDPTPVTLSKDEWIGVLKLARLWNMPQLTVMAVDKLSPDLSPIEKITMGKANAHRVTRWIKDGYTAVIGDLNELTLEGLAADLGWETTARVLWALKKAAFKAQPALANLSTSEVVDEIVEVEFGVEKVQESPEAGSDPTYLEAIPSRLRITVTQKQPVPRRAGTASIISFSPDGVYVSRDYTQAPTRVLQDFGYDAGWRVEKHVRLVGDTTGCGRSDIIGFGDAGVYVSRNNGDGTFTPAKLVLNDFGYNHGWRVDKHLRYVVDLRKKGFVDIIGFGDEGVYVALNQGNGTFNSPKIAYRNYGYKVGGWTLERHLRFLADVTGNGLPDIIGFGENHVSVSLNKGDGTFQESKVAIENFTPAAGGWLVEKHPRTIADMTGDGRPDIIGFFDDGVHVALNAGNGTFHPPKLVVSAFGYSRAAWRVGEHSRFVADLTGDGRGDIVGCGDTQVYVSRNNGDATFEGLKSLVDGFSPSHRWRVGRHLWLPVDLKGHGAADIIGFGEDAVWVSYNDGKGSLASPTKLRDYTSGDPDSRSIDKTVYWVTNLFA